MLPKNDIKIRNFQNYRLRNLDSLRQLTWGDVKTDGGDEKLSELKV